MTIAQFWNSGWTAALFNHLWQSTCVVLVAWLLSRALRSNPARVRYSIWMLASVKFLVPFALLANLGSRWAKPVAGRAIGSVLYTAVDEISRPFQQTQSTLAPSVVSSHPADVFAWVPCCARGSVAVRNPPRARSVGGAVEARRPNRE